jgi:hypothetical protein
VKVIVQWKISIGSEVDPKRAVDMKEQRLDRENGAVHHTPSQAVSPVFLSEKNGPLTDYSVHTTGLLLEHCLYVDVLYLFQGLWTAAAHILLKTMTRG